MNIDINQDSIMNESFKMTIFNAKNLFKANLGDVVNVDEMKLFLHQGFLEMVIPLRSQVMAEDMTEKFDKLMKLNILYAANHTTTNFIRCLHILLQLKIICLSFSWNHNNMVLLIL